MADGSGRRDDGIGDGAASPSSSHSTIALPKPPNSVWATLITLLCQFEEQEKEREKERDMTQHDLRQRIANLENQLKTVQSRCTHLEHERLSANRQVETTSLSAIATTTEVNERQKRPANSSEDTVGSNTDATSVSSSENICQSKSTPRIIHREPRPVPEDVCFAPRPSNNTVFAVSKNTNPTGASPTTPRLPAKDVCFAPRPSNNTVFAVSKNTNPTGASPTTPKLPAQNTNTNVNNHSDRQPLFCTPTGESGMESTQEVASGGSNHTSLFGHTPVSSFRENESRPLLSFQVSPTKNPSNQPRKPCVPNRREAIETLTINTMQPKSSKRPFSPQDPLTGQTLKRAKAYKAPLFDSSSSASPEPAFVLNKRWVTVQIGMFKNNPGLKGSWLHHEIVKMVRRKDSSNMDKAHRYKNMCRNTMEIDGPVICWLSQHSPLEGWKGPESKPGGRTMCNQCVERGRRGLIVECFYFDREDRIVVFRP